MWWRPERVKHCFTTRRASTAKIQSIWFTFTMILAVALCQSIFTVTPYSSHQTEQPQDHIKDLCFRKQVLSKLDTCQRLQKGDCPVNKECFNEHKVNIVFQQQAASLTQTPSTGFRLSCTVCLSGMRNTAWSERGKSPVNRTSRKGEGPQCDSPLAKLINYLTVGAVMMPMNKIRHQLRGWLAGKMKICFRKNVFSSVSCKKKEERIHLICKKCHFHKNVSLYLLWPSFSPHFCNKSWHLHLNHHQTITNECGCFSGCVYGNSTQVFSTHWW